MNEIFEPEQREELNELTEQKFFVKDFIRKNKVAVITAGVLIVALGTVAFILLRQKPQPAPVSNSVFLTIKGPSQLSSGNEADYTVVYRNGENSDLINLTLELFYPSGFKFKSATPAPVSSAGARFNLPLVKSGENGEVKIRGKLSGATADDKLIAAKLTYKLADFNSEFEVRTDFHTLILAPSITIDIAGPIDVIQGQETTYSVVYSNVSGQDFEKVVLQLQHPEGFSFITSTPKPSKNDNYWIVPKHLAGCSGQIDITGSFSGEANQEKLVVAEIGQLIGNTLAPLLNASANFKIIPASLFLNVRSEPGELVELGDSVEFNLEYGNQSYVGASNVVITVTLESTILDLNKISVYDAIVAGNTITWKSGTLSNLGTISPNQRGEISFSVPVKANLSSNLKNQIIKIMATIKSDQMPKLVRADALELKLVSNLGLLVSGEYVKGALPMKVGLATTFAVTMLVTNLSNDLSNTEVTTSLLQTAGSWNESIVPESEKPNLSYDPNSGLVRWKIGDLAAFSGKFTPARSVTFQIVVTPTESDRGKVPRLLSEIKAEGLDTFVNQTVSSATVRGLDASDLDDDQIQQAGSTVE